MGENNIQLTVIYSVIDLLPIERNIHSEFSENVNFCLLPLKGGRD